MGNIKIFATQSESKDRNVFIKNDVIIPVLGGAAYKENKGNIQGDNVGENISSLNDIYCELTTQYWAWKNIDCDYYGFCHYRRFFSFYPKNVKKDDWNLIQCAYANDQSIQKLGLAQTKRMEKVIRQYDVITPLVVNLEKTGFNSVYEQFAQTPYMKAEILDLTIRMIREEYPKYYSAAKKYLYGHYFYPFNMFIMSKKLFYEYSSWLFEILDKLVENMEMEQYSTQSRRIPAHIAERLFGVYLTYLKETDFNLKIRELPVGFIQNMDQPIKITPAFPKNNIPIVMASNDFFAPILSAALCSLAEHIFEHNFYDIVILESDLQNKTKQRLRKLLKGKRNISLRFCNVSSIIDNYDLYVSHLITVETYYRFLIPELFDKYDKVLYLDGDLIIRQDVGKLFQIDIQDSLVGACFDITCAGLVNGFDEESYLYCKNKMKLKNPVKQFNAGVMIMNLKEFRRTYTTEYMLRFAEKGKFKFWDQDALNILCEGRICWLDSAWNYFADERNGWRGRINQYAPEKLYKRYQKAGENPYIYHFAGNEKPWFDPNYEYAEIFWHYMRKSNFYEVMIHRRIYEMTSMPIRDLRHFVKCILLAFLPENRFYGKAVRRLYRLIKPAAEIRKS